MFRTTVKTMLKGTKALYRN